MDQNNESKTERNAEIVALFLGGEISEGDLAKKYEISRERVRQLVYPARPIMPKKNCIECGKVLGPPIRFNRKYCSTICSIGVANRFYTKKAHEARRRLLTCLNPACKIVIEVFRKKQLYCQACSVSMRKDPGNFMRNIFRNFDEKFLKPQREWLKKKAEDPREWVALRDKLLKE